MALRTCSLSPKSLYRWSKTLGGGAITSPRTGTYKPHRLDMGRQFRPSHGADWSASSYQLLIETKYGCRDKLCFSLTDKFNKVYLFRQYEDNVWRHMSPIIIDDYNRQCQPKRLLILYVLTDSRRRHYVGPPEWSEHKKAPTCPASWILGHVTMSQPRARSDLDGIFEMFGIWGFEKW